MRRFPAILWAFLMAGCLAGPAGTESDRGGDRWEAGDFEVTGIVESFEPLERADGHFLLVRMRSPDPLLRLPHASGAFWEGRCSGVVVPLQPLEQGQSITVTVHLRETTFNGAIAVLAPELECPIGALEEMSRLGSDVGWISGCALDLVDWKDGWAEFELGTPGRRHDVANVTVTVARWAAPRGSMTSASEWEDALARTFVNMTQLTAAWDERPFTAVEDWGTLADGAGGRARFVDVDGSGAVDDLDRIRIRLPAEESGYQLYSVALGPLALRPPAGAMQCVGFDFLLLNGPDGPVRWQLPNRVVPRLRLGYDDDQRTATVQWMSTANLVWGDGGSTGVAPRCSAGTASVSSGLGSPKPLDGTATVDLGDLISGCGPGARLTFIDRATNAWLTQGHDFPA